MLFLATLTCILTRQTAAQSAPPAAPSAAPSAPNALPDSPHPSQSAGGLQQSDSQLPGSVGGTVMDPSGAAVVGARVKLTRQNHPSDPEILTGDDGEFSFASVPPGPFQLTITSVAFAPQTSTGVLHPGEVFIVPPIVLAVATEITQVQVVVPRVELADEEIKEQEKQRVFGVIPNFYVTYVPDAVPLTSKQKFGLAWKTAIDPVNFGVVGVIAGVQQAQNNFKDYGQGAQGYGKRYGASYADFVSDTFIGGAIFPSLLKQDPRYFYKGTGTTRSRVLYALANAVICKGDNGHWQPNYSSIAGSLAAGGISNLYYPANDRGAALVFENTLIGIGENAATNLLQEFVIRKLTANLPGNNNSNSQSKP
jgi:carboxypeptidase family protein